jgi:hypothetical protein
LSAQTGFEAARGDFCPHETVSRLHGPIRVQSVFNPWLKKSFAAAFAKTIRAGKNFH